MLRSHGIPTETWGKHGAKAEKQSGQILGLGTGFRAVQCLKVQEGAGLCFGIVLSLSGLRRSH